MVIDSPTSDRYFRHEALPDSKTHFRLLEILRAEPHGQVVCELTAWPMDSAPSYYAISYTWGDPKLCTHIMINGAPMFVRQNCEDVLRQAAFSRASKYVWVDALCIDQDSTEEKSEQVAIMGEIYRNSAHVFACLGLHADDSEYLFQTTETWQSLLSSIHSHVRISSSSSEGQWSISNPIPAYRWLALRCFFAMKASPRRRLLLAFGAFVKRPYFSRVWVRTLNHPKPICADMLLPRFSKSCISLQQFLSSAAWISSLSTMCFR